MKIPTKRSRLLVASVAALLILTTISCQLLATPPLRFAPDSMPKARVGVFYYVIIKIANNKTPAGEFSISRGSLPNGLRLQRLTGQDAVLVSGEPQEAGSFHFVLNVWCYGTNRTGQTGIKDYVILVNP